MIQIKKVIESKEPKESKLLKGMKLMGQLSKEIVSKGVELKLPEIIKATEKMVDKVNL